MSQYQPIHVSKFSNPSLNPSIRLSIYPSDLASMHLSSHTGSQARRRGRTHAHTITHAHTCTHLNPPIPPSSVSPSVAHIHTHTLSTHALEHAHTYTYMYAYSPGPVAQFAARQICNLSSIPGRDIEPKSSLITSVEIGHEIVSTAIFFLPLDPVRTPNLMI